MSIEQQLNLPQYRTEGVGFYSDISASKSFPSHQHSDIELVLILNSEPVLVTLHLSPGTYQSHVVRSEQLCIIPSEQQHSISWQQPVEYIIIFVSPVFLKKTVYDCVADSSFEIKGQYGFQDPLIQSLMETLRSVLQTEGTIEHLYIDTLINTLLMCLLKRYAGCQFIAAAEQPIQYQRWLKDVLDFIHCSLDQDLRLSKLAHLAKMSESSFCHLFKEYMDISPHQYVMQERISLAKELLLNQQMSIAEIAVCCGFNSQSHLTSYFRNYTGMTPKAYQRLT